MLEGLDTVSERRLQIRDALICGKLSGGAWCFSWTKCWIQGPSKNEIVVVLHDILTTAFLGPWIGFFGAIIISFATPATVELSALYLFRGPRPPHTKNSLEHLHKFFCCDEYGAYFSFG